MTGATLAADDWALWSTQCRLVVSDPAALTAARRLVDADLADIERACSRFRDDSELMRLRAGDNDVSQTFADLLRAALEAVELSDGAVDPTVGSALVALGYDGDIEEVRGTSVPGVRAAVRRPAVGRVVLRGRTVSVPAGVQLDLGATAKAVAADRCARLVHDRLGVGVLVSLGGDIATAGSPQGPDDESGWQVSVQDLPTDTPAQITLAAGAAVATSSTAKRVWAYGSTSVHHLLDPATGLPAPSPWRTVTVVAPTCFAANTASTATIVKGRSGLDWLTRTGLPARLVGRDGVRWVNGFPEDDHDEGSVA